MEVEIRAAGVVAVADACAAIHSALAGSDASATGAVDVAQLTPMKLAYYLWRLGKKDGFREHQRHATRDTVYY